MKENKQSGPTKYFFIVQEMGQEGHGGGVQRENKAEGHLAETKNTARLHLSGKKTNAGLFGDQPADLRVPSSPTADGDYGGSLMHYTAG